MRVLDPSIDIVQGGDSPDELIASVRATWEEGLFDDLTRAGGTGRVSVPVKGPRESVQETITRTAAELDARVIVMGSHGAGWLRRAVLGSVAMGVLTQAHCPVLVVGPRAEHPVAVAEGGSYTMLLTDDGSQGLRDTLDAVWPLAEASRLRLVLLHLYEPRLGDDGEGEETDRALRRLDAERARLPDPGVAHSEVRTLPDFERVDAALLRVADELGVQAVALATQGYSARRHILAGSVAVGVLKSARLPVLLVRRS